MFLPNLRVAHPVGTRCDGCLGDGLPLRRRWPVLVVALLGFGAPAVSTASAAPVESVLSLAEVEQRALQHDSGIQSVEAQHRAAVLAAPVAGQLPDPVLSVGVQNVPLDDFSMTRLPTTMAAVTLTQSLPPGDTLAERQRFAEAQAQAAEARVHLSRRSVVRTVASDWLVVFRAEQTIRLLHDQQALYRRLQRSADTAYSTGRVSAAAWVTLGVRLSELSDQIGQARGEADAARARLARWVGGRSLAPWPDALPTALTELPVGALDDQPALRALRAQVTAEQAAVGEAKAAFEPALGVSVGYGINAGSMPNTGSIGVSISLPLFTGSRQTPQLRAAQQRLGSAQFALDDKAAQLHAQQAALQASVQSLSARLVNYDQHILPDLSRISRLVQNQFGAGNGDFSAVIDAQESLISARLARLTLSWDRARQLIDLRYLLEKSS